MAQEGMWEHVGLQRGSGKSERAGSTRRKGRCWKAMTQGGETRGKAGCVSPWRGAAGRQRDCFLIPRAIP